FGWAYWNLGRATTVFRDLFASMGVELPVGTRFVISSHGWLYPTLFVGAAAVVVTKEVFMRDKKLSLALTSIIAFGVLFTTDWIVSALYSPLFAMIEKVSR